jgi:sugar/nucleoside kinase (ribokinase family)
MKNECEIEERVITHLMGDCPRHHILLGFDGFVDELCRAVDGRGDTDGCRMFDTIDAFAQRLRSAAGLSTAIELLPIQTRPGGNAPNMGEAVLKFGNELSLIAALGRDEIHPAFRGLAESCTQAISLADPGRTVALEFQDGKIMLNRLGGLKGMSWDILLERLSIEALIRLAGSVSLVGLLDWSIDPSLSEIFAKFHRVIACLENKPVIFFDLSDLCRRTDREIRDVYGIIRDYGTITRTILGLNESESISTINALSIAGTGIAGRAAAIRDECGITAVVIHSMEEASVATEKGVWWVHGPYSLSPVVSTGGGDNFNAGFCNAYLLDMEPGECALMAAYTSGYYVTHGRSPGREDLITFMKAAL